MLAIALEWEAARHAHWRVLLTVTLFTILDVVLVHPYFTTPSDEIMNMIASGVGILKRPDDHLLYTHFFIGRILQWLYSNYDSIPWYGLYMVGVQFAANLVICISVCRYYRSWLPNLLIPLYLLVVAAPNLNHLQFTVTSAIAATAGGVLLFGSQRKDPDNLNLFGQKAGSKIAAASGMAFLLLSSLIRREGLWLSITVFVIYLAVRFGIRKEPKVLLRIVFILAATVIVAWSTWLANDIYYDQTGWHNFETYAQLQKPLFDYGRANFPERNKILTPIGWTENDFHMLSQGRNFDRATFGCNQFKNLLSHCPPFRGDAWHYGSIQLQCMVLDHTMQAAVCSILLMLLFFSGDPISRRRFLVFCLVALGLIASMAFFWKLAPRIYLSVINILFVSALFSIDQTKCSKIFETASRRKLGAIILAAGMTLVPSICGLVAHLKQVSIREETRAAQESFLNYLLLDKDKLILSCAGNFINSYMRPFETTKELKQLEVVTCYTSWMPFGQSLMHAHGISNFTQGLDSENVLVVAFPSDMRHVGTFFLEHKSIAITPEILFSRHPKRLNVYRIHCKRLPPAY